MGCAYSDAAKLLPAPSGTRSGAIEHNDKGIQAYNEGRWIPASEHFEAAIKIAPDLAEAHYNFGMLLYQTGAEEEARSHLIRAMELSPGNDVIRSTAARRSVPVHPNQLPVAAFLINPARATKAGLSCERECEHATSCKKQCGGLGETRITEEN